MWVDDVQMLGEAAFYAGVLGGVAGAFLWGIVSVLLRWLVDAVSAWAERNGVRHVE